MRKVLDFLSFFWANAKVKTQLAWELVRDWAFFPVWKGVRMTGHYLLIVPVLGILGVVKQVWWGIRKIWRHLYTNKREIGIFLHITLGVGFIIWGIELLSWWRILIGIYVLLWVGVTFLYHLFRIGLYLGEKE
jgi:hypothetical protein